MGQMELGGKILYDCVLQFIIPLLIGIKLI